MKTPQDPFMTYLQPPLMVCQEDYTELFNKTTQSHWLVMKFFRKNIIPLLFLFLFLFPFFFFYLKSICALKPPVTLGDCDRTREQGMMGVVLGARVT